MTGPLANPPAIGDWYQWRNGLFEIVAIDEADGTLEIQYEDGSLAEMELADFGVRCKAGTLQPAEQPEDYSGAIDVEQEGDTPLHGGGAEVDNVLNARGLDDLDLFD